MPSTLAGAIPFSVQGDDSTLPEEVSRVIMSPQPNETDSVPAKSHPVRETAFMVAARDVLAPYGLSTPGQARQVMPSDQYMTVMQAVHDLYQRRMTSRAIPSPVEMTGDERQRAADTALGLRPGQLSPDTVIGDERPVRGARQLAPVTLGLLLAIAAVFLVESAHEGGSQSVVTLYDLGATTPDTLQDGQWWRLVASCFLHIGIVHLVGNAIALFWLGRMAEQLYGSLRYLGIYLAAGIGGSIMAVCLSTSAIEAGASGAIWGVMGALLVGSWRNADRPGRISGRAIRQSIGSIIILNVIISFTPGVSLSAHLGGCVSGSVLALCIPFAGVHESQATRTICTAASCAIIVVSAALMLTIFSTGWSGYSIQ